jgi:Na+-transporting NADH:ubiquinone oxidoreductase subunit B
MKPIRIFMDKLGKHFTSGGKLERFFPMYEAVDTFLFTPGKTAKTPPFVRDIIDLKRVMTTVIIALVPCILMACYNTGYQINLALAKISSASAHSWQYDLVNWLGIQQHSSNIFGNCLLGLFYFLPIYLVTFAVGISWEILFAVVRKHEINEGFFVTSMLFPLILPPTIPLWQVALGISFGVVIGKEVFGGVGMNILNPALTARVFLFFAYPLQISGDRVWIAVDGISQATPLAQLADSQAALTISWWDAFLGLIPGSLGETSTLACLIGALILIITGIGSWKIISSTVIGAALLAFFFNLVGSSVNPMFSVSFWWHLVLGGFAFGVVFMATDPVSAAMTEKGKIIYGLLVGSLIVFVRVLNPGFPEGVMLAILFGNICAPLIDRIFISANMKRRTIRYGR